MNVMGSALYLSAFFHGLALQGCAEKRLTLEVVVQNVFWCSFCPRSELCSDATIVKLKVKRK
jgi:hypothetical protein